VCVCVCVCVKNCYVKIFLSQSMSESMSFRHIVISTHKNVEISRAETMCTFSVVHFTNL
jgi:hypothetical protein